MNHETIKIIGDVFDVKSGSFSLIQNNMMKNYLSLKGMKSVISCCIFNRIVSSVYVEVSKEKNEDGFLMSSRIGTIWSEPCTLSAVLSPMYKL